MHCIVAIILSSLSVLFDIIGLAIPYWYYYKEDGVTVYFGLWKLCLGDICQSFPDAPSAILATRALEILGMLLLIAALAMVLLKQFMMKDKTILTKIGGACALFGGVLMIIGCVVFVTNSDVKASYSVGLTLHAGFGLCILAGVLAFPAGIVMALLKD